MVITYWCAKVQGQRSVGSENRVETRGQKDGRTEAIALYTSHANAVGNNYAFIRYQSQIPNQPV